MGMSLRRAGELDKFNIHWDFLDEVFSSIMDRPYSNLVSVKFEINGTVIIDGIEGLSVQGCLVEVSCNFAERRFIIV